MTRCLLIYFDGIENKAVIRENDFPESTMPHTWGLDDDAVILAAIPISSQKEQMVVYIDEELVYARLETSGDNTNE